MSAALHLGGRDSDGALETPAPLLRVEALSVRLATERGEVRAVNDLSLSLAPGCTLGVVGESGCGKTMLTRAVLGLLPANASQSGRVLFDGQDLGALKPEALRRLRGRSIAVVFQDPMTSLNPVLSIGTQIVETLQAHMGMGASAARRRAVELLASVDIPEPVRRLGQYPHELSGGMRQRVAIAIALSCEPRLLIADEPTTALDVTVQAHVLDLLAREQRRRQMAMVLVTHDLGVVARCADTVAVMYAGRIVEHASARRMFAAMRMPYTAALLAAIPRVDAAPHARLAAIAGRPPDLARLPAGCAFAPRCPRRVDRCTRSAPSLEEADDSGHRFACWNPIDEGAGSPREGCGR